MKGRVSGYRLAMAALLFVMICSMCFFPMLKGSKFGIGNISYVRSIGSIWREASFSQTSGSAVGTVIWMLIAFILIVISLVLILIPDVPRILYGTVSLIGSLSVVLLMFLMLASDRSTFEGWGNLASALTERSFGIGLYVSLLAGFGVVVLSGRALSNKDSEPKDNAFSGYEQEPQTIIYPESKNTGEGRIVCLSGHAKGSSFRIPEGGEISVGRDPAESDIVIETENSDVSRCHCIIRFDPERKYYFVRDVSKNGTSVSTKENGDRIALPGQTEVEIRPGSVLHIGKGNNRFRLE